MGTKVQVCAEHVSLIEIAIPKRRLAPIVIANLFPNLPRLATKGEVPVLGVFPQRNIFDRVPDVRNAGRLGPDQICSSAETPKTGTSPLVARRGEIWEQIGNDNWGQSPFWNGYLNERYMLTQTCTLVLMSAVP